ncbi:MAG: FKBP-type peptidyl-prolyl cis-trans isomerase [Woeseiaceae bacterium]|nr:FKBP-type peptidyl-prolyl cis-trans isomerase [Woeseiaceae bacterium]
MLSCWASPPAAATRGRDSGIDEPDAAPAVDDNITPGETTEIAPGLTARILRAGSGETATAGDTAVVHYTGWLYDPSAENNRGDKFDSSVDRGQHFRFPLGAGRVIPGWDQGVAGMQVGEVRELTIAPEMAYGDRGAGDVIPPGSTLVFEVELAGIESPAGGS